MVNAIKPFLALLIFAAGIYLSILYKQSSCQELVDVSGWKGDSAEYNPLKGTCTIFFEDGSFKRFSY